jgi:hypothetical protein
MKLWEEAVLVAVALILVAAGVMVALFGGVGITMAATAGNFTPRTMGFTFFFALFLVLGLGLLLTGLKRMS